MAYQIVSNFINGIWFFVKQFTILNYSMWNGILLYL